MTEHGRKHTDGSRSGGQPLVKTQHCPNCEATEQKLHDFRQEVSHELINQGFINASTGIGRFIIPAPKPDPLVEVLADMGLKPKGGYDWASEFRNTLAQRGLEIREKGE